LKKTIVLIKSWLKYPRAALITEEGFTKVEIFSSNLFDGF